MFYAHFEAQEARRHRPKIALLDASNRVTEILT
jgi:aspartate 1-decarboxylase